MYQPFTAGSLFICLFTKYQFLFSPNLFKTIRKLLRSVHGSLSVTYDIMNYNTLSRGVFHNAVNIGRDMQKNVFVLKYLKKYMTIKIFYSADEESKAGFAVYL